MHDRQFDELLESVKEMDDIIMDAIMDANELRYRFTKLAENYSHFYVLNALLAMMTQNQLKEYYDYFNQLHPAYYDEDGNEIQ